MRKHYVPAVLGILFIAALIMLQSNTKCEAPLCIKFPKEITVKIEVSDKLASALENPVSFLLEEAQYQATV